ncbi:MAG: polyhydroxyalkanoate depolymerase, partial [Ottowia sp.]|nr:polyhydroxyalkanoate depolymerase [Ottowia sp.]
ATLLRDTVRTMLEGHKVYITDWKNACTVPLSDGEFHLDDYVNYVQDFIRHLQAKYGNCHVVSVCQPTVPVLGAVSLMASRGEKTPITMTMMGGPIDARKSPTAVNDLAVQRSFEWFENNVIYRVPPNYPGAGRRVYPGFMQHAGFIAMNPDRHRSSHYDYFRDLIKGDESSAETHRQFYDEYNAVLDMDADYYLETIRTVFQDFNLVHGTWDIRSPQGVLERVRPQDITTTALQTVEGELDDISGSGQTRAAHNLCEQIVRRQGDHLEVKGAGHYGIFSGRRWRTVVYPQIKAFIADFHAKAALDAEVATPAPVANARARAADQAAEQIQLVIDRVEGPPEDPVAAATLPVVPPAPRARNGVARAAVKTAVTTAAKPSAVNGAVAPAKKARAAAKPVSANGRAKPVAKAVAKPAAKAARKTAAKPAP